MGIQNEIDRIKENVADAYSAVEERGGTVPEAATVGNLAAAVSSIPKGTILTTDETLNMSEDNVLSVTVPVKELTEAEYNALPQSKKDSGLYFVKSTPMTVGEIVQWAGYDWIVVNDNGDGTVVLAMNEIYEQTEFGSTSYANSILKTKVNAFENSLPSVALQQAVDTVVSGVASKVFVPIYQQVFGGEFSYFNSNSRRRCMYNGQYRSWWLSADEPGYSGYIVAVCDTGGYIRSRYVDTNGFRPFITVKESEQKTTVYLNGKELDGPTGVPGVTFIPHVSSDGILSWTNDGDLDNPEPVNIKGPVGETDGPIQNESTEETVVGTFNGKPRYRKTIVMDAPAEQNGSTNYDALSLNIDNLISLSGIGKASNGSCCELPLTVYNNNNGGFHYFGLYFASGRYIRVTNLTNGLSATAWLGCECTVTIEYTKAVD